MEFVVPFLSEPIRTMSAWTWAPRLVAPTDFATECRRVSFMLRARHALRNHAATGSSRTLIRATVAVRALTAVQPVVRPMFVGQPHARLPALRMSIACRAFTAVAHHAFL